MMNSNLSNYLDGLLQEWDQARKPQELLLLECYQDYMRIARDGDTKATGVAKTSTNKPLFIGATRAKIRSASCKVNDTLFGNGVLPFDITAKDERLEQYSDVFERIITGQLEAMDFREMMSTGNVSAATYGTSFFFGPFVRKATRKQVAIDQSGIVPQMVEMEYEYDEPYYELGNTLDCYPDPAARNMKAAQGLFWVSMWSPAQVEALSSDPSYKNVMEAARIPDTASIENGSDRASSLRGNLDYWYKEGRIKFVRYFGKVPREKLADLQITDLDNPTDSPADVQEDAQDRTGFANVVVIMAGGYVLKVTEIDEGDVGVLRQCWENSLDEMWGVGIAENNFAMQRITNAAFRIFTESKGLALNPVKAVDRSKFLPSEDFKQYPGKVYQFKPGLSPDEKNSAIIPMITPDVSDGWMSLINMAGQFSDDDTGITKYTQGDDSNHLNKTASGMSMIMSASSLPLKEVVQHCDQTTEAMIEKLIDWNLTFMEPKTVEILYGKEDAAIWAQIKQLGKASFIDWKATGTSSFMAKEVLTSKLQQFMGMALGNPATAQLVDAGELLVQVWDAMEVGRKSPIKTPEKGEPAQLPPEVQQKLQEADQMQQQMDAAIQKMQAELDSKQSKEQTEAQKAANDSMQLQIDQFKAETDRIRAEADAALKANSDLKESEKVQFQADMQKLMEDMRQDFQVELAILTDKLAKGGIPSPLEQKAAADSLIDAGGE